MRTRSGMVGLILFLVGTGVLLLQSPAESPLELRIAPNDTNSAAWDLTLYGSSATSAYTFLSATGFPLTAESPRAVRLGVAFVPQTRHGHGLALGHEAPRNPCGNGGLAGQGLMCEQDERGHDVGEL